MRHYKQEPPFAVQIELVEGCNLYCSMCGLQGIREQKAKNLKFMTEKTLRSLFEQMVEKKWNPRCEFAVHGEPSLHPELINMIALARSIAPRYHLMMTSNGGGLLQKPGPLENIRRLFDAGLNVLALDDYKNANIIPKIRTQVTAEKLEAEVYEYPSDPKGNPHRRGPRRMLSFVADINDANHGTHSMINNHAGAGAPPNDSQAGKRCAKPFREMTVRWDGNVAICCNSWRGQYKCGNVVRDGLDSVWNGDAFYAARQKLLHGQRDFGECKGCDAVSYRVGLLPDKKGKETMPKPNKKTDEAIAAALAGDPYTRPVLRPWEK